MRRIKILACLLLCTCGQSQKKELQEMADLMTDLYLAQGYAALYASIDSTPTIKNVNLDSLLKYNSQVYQAHGITHSEVVKKIQKFSSKPELMDSIMKMTQRRIEKLKDSLDRRKKASQYNEL